MNDIKTRADHAWQLVPGIIVQSPSFGRGIVIFVSGEHAHIRTPDTVVIERADELQMPAVRRFDGVLVRAPGAPGQGGARQHEKLENGVVCQEESARIFVLLSNTQESVWVHRAHVCLFETVDVA